MPARPEVLQICPLAPGAEAGLDAAYTVHRLWQAGDPDALIARCAPGTRAIATSGGPSGRVDAALMDRLPNLEIVAVFGVGVDSVDLAAAAARGVAVANTPGVMRDAVAELTVGLMVALARRIPQADAFVRRGDWAKGAFPLRAGLSGRTVGLVGLGVIGAEIARRLQAMRMRVLYHTRRRRPEQPWTHFDNLVEMARAADWLVLIAPATPETERMIGREALEALGPEGALVNVARGALVDEPVLIEMLASGRLGGAALDVYATQPDPPAALRRLDNVVLSPHAGSGTVETRAAMGELLLANLEAHFAGRALPAPVAPAQ